MKEYLNAKSATYKLSILQTLPVILILKLGKPPYIFLFTADNVEDAKVGILAQAVEFLKLIDCTP